MQDFAERLAAWHAPPPQDDPLIVRVAVDAERLAQARRLRYAAREGERGLGWSTGRHHPMAESIGAGQTTLLATRAGIPVGTLGLMHHLADGSRGDRSLARVYGAELAPRLWHEGALECCDLALASTLGLDDGLQVLVALLRSCLATALALDAAHLLALAREAQLPIYRDGLGLGDLRLRVGDLARQPDVAPMWAPMHVIATRLARQFPMLWPGLEEQQQWCRRPQRDAVQATARRVASGR